MKATLKLVYKHSEWFRESAPDAPFSWAFTLVCTEWGKKLGIAPADLDVEVSDEDLPGFMKVEILGHDDREGGEAIRIGGTYIPDHYKGNWRRTLWDLGFPDPEMKTYWIKVPGINL